MLFTKASLETMAKTVRAESTAEDQGLEVHPLQVLQH